MPPMAIRKRPAAAAQMAQAVPAARAQLQEAMQDGAAAAVRLAVNALQPPVLLPAGPEEAAAAAVVEQAVEPAAEEQAQERQPVPQLGPPISLSGGLRFSRWLRQHGSDLCRTPIIVAWALLAFVLCYLLVTVVPWRVIHHMVASAVGAAGAAAETTSIIFSAASNLTSAVSSRSVDTISGTRSLAHDLVRGVEISDLHIAANGQTMLASSVAAVHRWMENQTQLPASLAAEWQEQLTRIENGDLNAVELTHSSMEVSKGKFYLAKGEVTRVGQEIGFRYVLLGVSFTTFWSNPLWDVLGLPTQLEHRQIFETLNQAVDAHPLYKQYCLEQPWQSRAVSWFR